MLRALTMSITGYLFLLGSVAHAGGKQTLVIDSRHLMAGKENKQAKPYVIKPTQHLVVDFSQYKFLPGPDGKISKPDTMSMIVDSKRQYYYKITNNKSVHSLSAETLTHNAGFQPFKGLKSGDKFILAIGNLGPSKKGDKQIFKVAWIGFVKVSK